MYRGEDALGVGEIVLENKFTKQQETQQKLDYIFNHAPYLEVKNEKYNGIKKNVGKKVSELLAFRGNDSISIEKFKQMDIWVVSQKILLLISTNDCKYEELLSYISDKYKYFRFSYEGYNNYESEFDYENRCKSIIDDFIELGIIVREGDNLSYRFKKQNM